MIYFNDNEPYVAKWLTALYPDAIVNSGSVCAIQAGDLAQYRRVHLFAGIGGWEYALRLAGWPDDREVWTGSCPCQPFSNSGKRKGIDDERHLWPEFLRLISERRPTTIFGEQVASPLGREWLFGVRADLEALGYAVGAADLCAAGVGAPHIRQRLYWVADADHAERRAKEPARHNRDWQAAEWDESNRDAWQRLHGQDWRAVAAGFCADAHGLSARVGRLRAYGNAIVPQIAAQFVRAFMGTER